MFTQNTLLNICIARQRKINADDIRQVLKSDASIANILMETLAAIHEDLVEDAKEAAGVILEAIFTDNDVDYNDFSQTLETHRAIADNT
jgi:hypothetical protein